jgi:hypothetical protein
MPGRRLADHHPPVGMGDDDARLTAVEGGTDRGGVVGQAWPGSGWGDAGLTAGGQRNRSAGDAALLQESGDGRPPPRPVADERAVNEENSHACDGRRSARQPALENHATSALRHTGHGGQDQNLRKSGRSSCHNTSTTLPMMLEPLIGPQYRLSHESARLSPSM